MERVRKIESFFIKKSSQDTETSATVPGKMPTGPGPSAITLDSEPEETSESEIEPGPETQIKKPKMYPFRHDWLTQLTTIQLVIMNKNIRGNTVIFYWSS